MPRSIRLGGKSAGMRSNIASHLRMARSSSAGPKRRSAASAAAKTAAPISTFFMSVLPSLDLLSRSMHRCDVLLGQGVDAQWHVQGAKANGAGHDQPQAKGGHHDAGDAGLQPSQQQQANGSQQDPRDNADGPVDGPFV